MAFAPGLRPHLGLNGYKPFVLLYTTGGMKWRNAEGMLPYATRTYDFFSGEPRFACPVHVPLLPAVRTPGANAPSPNRGAHTA